MNTFDEALNAMAGALHSMGYARATHEDETDLTPDQIDAASLEYATGRMIKKLVEVDDTAFLFEFLVEGGSRDDDKTFFTELARVLTLETEEQKAEVYRLLIKRVTDYGRDHLDEAIERMAV